MHYRHSYHAANFADVFKHVLLCGLVTALNRKDKPWCYLETHAGAGMYDLGGESASRTGEWVDGIGRLADVQSAPEMLQTYLGAVRAANADQKLKHYPGSPCLVQHLARADDRLLLCEKVPAVADELKIAMGRDARVAIHVRDGYEAHSLLPPKEKRGLILVDPPFERTDELDAMGDFAVKASSRFSGGIIALWYPVKQRREVDSFLRRMNRELTRSALNLEFDNGASNTAQTSAAGVTKLPMTTTGLLVINPPFQFEEAAREALAVLKQRLSRGPRAAYQVEWVRSE